MLASVVMLAPQSEAVAQPVASAAPVAPLAPLADDYWRHVVEPHAAELAELVGHFEAAEHALAAGDAQPWLDPTGAARTAVETDLAAMCRYGLAKNAAHAELRYRCGALADDRGQAALAHADLSDAMRAPTPLPPRWRDDAQLRLANLALRRGDVGTGEAFLRELGQRSGLEASRARALLAVSLMARGHLTEALEATRGHDLATGTGLETWVRLVALDRDERPEVATALGHLAGSTTGFGVRVSVESASQAVVGELRGFPLDVTYLLALAYQADQQLADARALWLTYAAGGPAARYRHRALAHVRTLDRLLRAAPEAP